MKVQFYPRDIGMFRNGDFDFSLEGSNGTIARDVTNYKIFHDRGELIEYLKRCGVRLDDANYPLIFDKCNHYVFGDCYSVHQWSLIGWMKEL